MQSRVRDILTGVLLFTLFSPLFLSVSAAGEVFSWPRFDGPEYNRISREMRLPLSWQSAAQEFGGEAGETPLVIPSENSARPELWQIEGLEGIGTPLVFNDKTYLLDVEPGLPAAQAGEPAPQPRYFIDCWSITERDPDARFRYEIPPFLSKSTAVESAAVESTEVDHNAPASASAPMLVGDPVWRQLFCLLPTGKLLSLDSDLGSQLWSASLPELLEQTTPPDAVALPLVFEHLLITALKWHAQETAAETVFLVALDRRNSQICWLQRFSPPVATVPLQMQAALIPCVYQGQICLASQFEPGKLQLFQIRTGKPVLTQSLQHPAAQIQEVLYESERLAVLSAVCSTPVEEEAVDVRQAVKSVAKQDWTLEVFALPRQRTVTDSVVESSADQLTRVTHWELADCREATSLLIGNHLLAATSQHELLYAPISQPDQQKKFALSGDGRHFLLAVDQQVLVTSTSGHWEVFALEPDAAQSETARPDNPRPGSTRLDNPDMPAPAANAPPAFQGLNAIYAEQWNEPIMALPAIAKQRVFVQLAERMVALGPIDTFRAVSDLQLEYSDLAEELNDNTAGQLQLIPASRKLSPGLQLNYQVLQYNAQGAYLGLTPPEEAVWNWDGPGELNPATGILQLDSPIESESVHHLSVEWNGIRTTARVVLTPPEHERKPADTSASP